MGNLKLKLVIPYFFGKFQSEKEKNPKMEQLLCDRSLWDRPSSGGLLNAAAGSKASFGRSQRMESGAVAQRFGLSFIGLGSEGSARNERLDLFEERLEKGSQSRRVG